MALGGLGAGQGDQFRLGLAVECPRPTRPVLWLAVQGPVEAALGEPVSDAFDGAGAEVQGLGDAGVIPGRALQRSVGFE